VQSNYDSSNSKRNEGTDVAKGENWNDAEIAATVADYMRMYVLDRSGQQYNKSEHRRKLLQLLDGRSDAAVELKHQNISAVLLGLECHWLPGYKPRGNYQRALAECVEDWINSHPEFDVVSRAAAEQPAFVPSEVDFQRMVVEAPKPTLLANQPLKPYSVPLRATSKRDYVAREARNSALGKAGELLALEFEKFRLCAAGHSDLAEQVQHVSMTRGDGLGYDILSFEPTGKERFVEVKTTAFAKETPFFASRNEVEFAREASDQFHLYRLFDFRKTPKLFSLQGDLAQYCTLDPVNYLCQFQ
jgi:hypothetical protein